MQSIYFRKVQRQLRARISGSHVADGACRPNRLGFSLNISRAARQLSDSLLREWRGRSSARSNRRPSLFQWAIDGMDLLEARTLLSNYYVTVPTGTGAGTIIAGIESDEPVVLETNCTLPTATHWDFTTAGSLSLTSLSGHDYVVNEDPGSYLEFAARAATTDSISNVTFNETGAGGGSALEFANSGMSASLSSLSFTGSFNTTVTVVGSGAALTVTGSTFATNESYSIGAESGTTLTATNDTFSAGFAGIDTAASSTITECTFYSEVGIYDNSSPYAFIQESYFRDSGVNGFQGSAIDAYNNPLPAGATLAITNGCLFVLNSATSGSIATVGVDMASNSNFSIIAATFSGDLGPDLTVGGSGTATVNDVDFNRGTPSNQQGPGLYVLSGATANVTNCYFSGNYAKLGILNSGTLSVSGSTFYQGLETGIQIEGGVSTTVTDDTFTNLTGNVIDADTYPLAAGSSLLVNGCTVSGSTSYPAIIISTVNKPASVLVEKTSFTGDDKGDVYTIGGGEVELLSDTFTGSTSTQPIIFAEGGTVLIIGCQISNENTPDSPVVLMEPDSSLTTADLFELSGSTLMDNTSAGPALGVIQQHTYGQDAFYFFYSTAVQNTDTWTGTYAGAIGVDQESGTGTIPLVEFLYSTIVNNENTSTNAYGGGVSLEMCLNGYAVFDSSIVSGNASSNYSTIYETQATGSTVAGVQSDGDNALDSLVDGVSNTGFLSTDSDAGQALNLLPQPITPQTRIRPIRF